jgi:hypothetical protein
MAGITEAACLLEQGTTYSRRCLLNREGDSPVFAGFKRGAFSLYFGDAPIVHFDLEGRWQRAFIEDIHYLKGLDSVTQSIDRVRVRENMVLQRRTLSYDEAVDLDSSIRSLLVEMASRLDANQLDIQDPPPAVQPLGREELRDFLEQIIRWNSSAWFAHRERYVAAYPFLPCLPPDCPGAVVLRADAPEFERHVLDVLALLGRAIDPSRTIYLSGDVFAQPFGAVVGILEVVDRRLPDHAIQLLLDEFSRPLPSVDQWRALQDFGLGRVSLGVASGSSMVRASLGYSWRDDELVAAVAALKDAEIHLGLIVPVGSGGQANSEAHLEDTPALLRCLPLGPGDLVSLLMADDLTPLASSHRPDPTHRPLSDAEREASLARLKERLGPDMKARKARVAPFRLEKQGI